MQPLYFFVVGLIQLSIGIYGTVQLRRHFSWYALLVLIIVYGLAYDNLALAMGGILPAGDALKALNVPRYIIHALFTPCMIISAFGALRMTGSKFAQSKMWHTVICVVALLLILLGSYIDIINLTLVPQTQDGMTRYVNQFHLFRGPPIPAVTTIIIVLIFGIVLWRNTKFPWLFIGSLIMLLTAGAVGNNLVQNLGEISFALGQTVTQIFAARRVGNPRAKL
jgi:hypothetical protein